MSKKSSTVRPPKIVVQFRPGYNVGEPAAEDDERFLRSCFVDTGYVETVLDPKNLKSIVVGRTGSGKSALLAEISKRSSNVIRITPEDLALQHIANSTILRKLEEINVNLDIFYQALWYHVFCVELIKNRYDPNKHRNVNLVSALAERAGLSQSKKSALKYLESWDKDQFWNEAGIQAVTVRQRFEDEISEHAGADLKIISGKSGPSKSEEQEITANIKIDAQRVVDAVKIRDLQNLIDLLASHVFDDVQNPYYVILDDLDKNWVDDRVRFKLIRALIESIKKLRRIPNVKIIIGVRRDLLDKVISETRDSGFQEEKYENMYLKIKWTDGDLRRLIVRRLNEMLKSQYTKGDLDISDVLPQKVNNSNTFQFLLERTQRRPREIIQFVNKILGESAGKTNISATNIRQAEFSYSEQRVRAIADEWMGTYPYTERLLRFLKGRKPRFRVSEMDVKSLSDLALDLITLDKVDTRDILILEATKLVEDGCPLELRYYMDFFGVLLSIMHRMAVVGLKSDPERTIDWNFESEHAFAPEGIHADTLVVIHPMLAPGLGVGQRHDEFVTVQ